MSALLGGKESYLVGVKAIKWVANKLKRPLVTRLLEKYKGRFFTRDELLPLIAHLTSKEQATIKTALAMCALREGKLGPPIRFLISDDGTNFKSLVKNHQLCWVHEIRKYKLCEVFGETASEELDQLLLKWRGFYHMAKRFLKYPTSVGRKRIREAFDKIVSIKTLIGPLNEQLERTKTNKENLLLFTRYPQLPLHSNQIENDLRERVIKRKISLQNRSRRGMQAWDVMLSLASTCRKLNINFYQYLYDRLSGEERLPYLGKFVMSR